jgi:hypothetical protein
MPRPARAIGERRVELLHRIHKGLFNLGRLQFLHRSRRRFL